MYYAGDIDEVRVWHVARTEEQIANAASKTLIGAEPGLAGYWNFDDATAADVTGATAAGTLTNGAITTASLLTLDTNTPPSADSGITVSVEAGQTVVIPITGTDADATVATTPDALEFSLDSNFSNDQVVFLTLTDANPGDQAATVSYTAPILAGTDTFGFTVSDGLDASASAQVTINITQPANSSALFDGTGDSVSFGDQPAFDFDTNDDFTVEVWVKPDTVQNSSGSGDNSIIEKVSGTPYPFLIRLANQDNPTPSVRWTLNASRRDTSSNRPIISSTALLDDGAWHHIAYTKTGSTLTLRRWRCSGRADHGYHDHDHA